ncbi:MAG: peptide-methionine (S)-S-oxide reductase MsrA [Bacteroidota bacterium]|nr:peptide-methionine (S)-S-oxide reductase MsrA [Bacteroidota bacterium]MDP4233566.1 peptide-methionine (S)-S-oxide reductase MsrA [Bacteroidota bacterium]MDP4243660.1 peptide-methionine (S)-S-oxide reductase MsrA [Bacteroidota bacterium]MDP4287752.1 peptide-methionine (S)-S-oxide reductase MsrA [Bacteroidota bacterium]
MNKRLKNGLGVLGLIVFVFALMFFRMCRPVARGTELQPQFDSTLEHATFAMGCFWHSEEIFLEIKGVKNAMPGYCGGTEPNPTYELVGSGSTRYAESVDVAFDPKAISYAKLLEVFFREHDPTTLDRQGPDDGPQYRSAIFYHTAQQKREADVYIAKLQVEHKYTSPIVTEVAPFDQFYRAEDYHIRYFRNHPGEPYIESVTRREVEQFRRDFPELRK